MILLWISSKMASKSYKIALFFLHLVPRFNLELKFLVRQAIFFFMELKRIAERLKESRRVGAGFRKN